MNAAFCSKKLEELTEVVQSQPAFTLTMIVFNLLVSPLTIFGNVLVILALWKASQIPDNLKRLFLNLAFSDLAVGMFIQPMSAVILAVVLSMVKSGNNEFEDFCPYVISADMYITYFLVAASFFTTAVIALDRLLSVFLHLRYHQLVTERRVRMGLVLIWFTSAVATLVFMLLPNNNEIVAVACQTAGLLVMTVAYIRLYKVVRYHKNQILSQTQAQNDEVLEVAREKKSAVNAFYVYIIFLVCFLPHLFARALLAIYKVQLSPVVAYYYASAILTLLNSSLNPLIYYWRYREIRHIVKHTVKKMFTINSHA